MGDMYMYLSSDQNSNAQPHNTGINFTVTLPRPLYLEGRWSACLLDINIQADTHKESALYVVCDLVNVSYASGEYHKILRCINTRANPHKETLFPLHYVTVDNTTHIDSITITILDSDTLQPTSLNIHKVSCALHLRQERPPYII